MENKMKILKTEELNEGEPKCPECKGILEFDGRERIEGKVTYLKSIIAIFKPNLNAWFSCEPCNKKYLIEDYAGVMEK